MIKLRELAGRLSEMLTRPFDKDATHALRPGASEPLQVLSLKRSSMLLERPQPSVDAVEHWDLPLERNSGHPSGLRQQDLLASESAVRTLSGHPSTIRLRSTSIPPIPQAGLAFAESWPHFFRVTGPVQADIEIRNVEETYSPQLSLPEKSAFSFEISFENTSVDAHRLHIPKIDFARNVQGASWVPVQNSTASRKKPTQGARDRGAGRSASRKRRGASAPPTEPSFSWDELRLMLAPPLNLEFPEKLPLPSKLYDFQVSGVEFLSDEKRGALLADDMGLGKTVQSIVALQILFQQGVAARALVVCRLSNLAHWEKEFQRWAPLLRMAVCHGNKHQRHETWEMPAHVCLTTYGTLRSDLEMVNDLDRKGRSATFDVAILDEISAIKNSSAKRSQAAKKLDNHIGWGLSGTPIENDVTDVKSIFDFLVPNLFPSADELHPQLARDLIGPYMLRRRKSDVLDDLPDMVRNPVWIDLTPEQQRRYDQAQKEGVLELQNELGRQRLAITHIFALLGRLKQICNIDPVSGTSGKLNWLADNLPEMTADGNVLIFSQYKDQGIYAIQEDLESDGNLSPDQIRTYSGDLSQVHRREVIDEFNDDPEMRVLLLTYGAGAMGLNLQAANYVVAFDHWWNPAIIRQAEDRAHRIGQDQTVFSYRLWVRNTIEDRIYEILENKKALYDEVIDAQASEGAGKTALTEDELYSLFDLSSS